MLHLLLGAKQVLSLAGVILAALLGPAAHAGEAAAQHHVVVIEAFAFVPSRLEIQAGDTVEWINRDLAPHTVTAEEADWDSGSMAKHARFARLFSQPGSVPYVCIFHPHMRGEIVVTR